MSTSREKVSIALRSIYALCFIGATCVHVMIHVRYGAFLQALASAGYPVGTRIFWSSLTIFDPLAAVLLFVRPRVGLALASVIIVADVAHNSWILHRFGVAPDAAYWTQVAFLLFLFATQGSVWRGLAGNSTRVGDC